jgi:dimethylargininase
MTRPVALLRDVPDSFPSALTSAEPADPIDLSAARTQHAAYRAALEHGGFATMVVPADEAHPDCVFIEDTAVVIGSRALATRPGRPERRGEVRPVAAALTELVAVAEMEAPATLDGGDVLQVGRTVFVGRSERTDAAGITALGRFARRRGRRTVPVGVDGVLHLKSAVTALDAHTVFVWPGVVDVAAFDGLRLIMAPGDDPHAANVVRLPDGTVLMAAGHPEAADILLRAGYAVVAVDVSEFATADGGVTCLSIRLHDVLAP